MPHLYHRSARIRTGASDPVVLTADLPELRLPWCATVLNGIECWLYQHGLRHMGEIDHARTLVGLGGMTS